MAKASTAQAPAHSRFGGSVAERFIHCPASVPRSEKFPPQGDNAFTIEGTEMHAECEQILTRYAQAGAIPRPDPKFSPEQARCIDECVSRVIWVYEDMQMRGQNPKLYLERRVNMKDLHPEFFGTADVLIVGDTELYLIDFKFGRGVEVDIEYNGKLNPQIGYYLLGALRELDEDHQSALTKITGEIVQPRFDPMVKTREVDWDDLFTLSKQLVAGAKAAESNNPPAAAGKWCRFCPARATCPEHTADVQARARKDFAKVNGDPSCLSPTELGKLLDDAQMIESWITAVKDHALHAIEYDGQEIPGWEAVPKRAIRKWKDEEKVLKIFERDEHRDKYVVEKPVSPAQAEKHGYAMEKLAKHIEQEPSGSKLQKKS